MTNRLTGDFKPGDFILWDGERHARAADIWGPSLILSFEYSNPSTRMTLNVTVLTSRGDIQKFHFYPENWHRCEI
jgi:hypothetical protein